MCCKNTDLRLKLIQAFILMSNYSKKLEDFDTSSLDNYQQLYEAYIQGLKDNGRIDKIVKAKKGKKYLKTGKYAKKDNLNKGKICFSNEARLKISQSKIGKKQSEETLIKRSNTLKSQYNNGRIPIMLGKH